jgi:Protein required for attachment to host cells
MRQHQRYSGSSPLGNRSGHSGHGHTFDDHRGAHDQHELRRNIKRVADEIDARARERQVTGVIVVASQSVESALKEALAQHRLARVQWITAELTHLTPSLLLHDLERRHVIA